MKHDTTPRLQVRATIVRADGRREGLGLIGDSHAPWRVLPALWRWLLYRIGGK